jgi:ABC-type uncharacterized transport system permease subunit
VNYQRFEQMNDQLVAIPMILLGIARCSTPLMFACLGAITGQTTGALNYALEAVMLSSALATVMVAQSSGNVLFGVMAGLATGLAIGCVQAIAVQRFKLNDIFCGMALTIMAIGATALVGANSARTIVRISASTTAFSPMIEPVNGTDLFPAMAIVAAILFSWYLKRTHTGISLRALASDASMALQSGVNVQPLRTKATIFSSIMGAAGGAYIPLALTNGWHDGLSGGSGFVALALVMFIGCSPIRAILVAGLFGSAQVLQWYLHVPGANSAESGIGLIPYAVTLGIVLVTAVTRNLHKAETITN